MGVEQSRLLGRTLIEVSEAADGLSDLDDGSLPKESLCKILDICANVLENLPSNIRGDIDKKLKLDSRRLKQRSSGKTTITIENSSAHSVEPTKSIEPNSSFLPYIHLWIERPERFFTLDKTTTASPSRLCQYIRTLEQEGNLDTVRLRYAIRQFSLSRNSWGRYGLQEFRQRVGNDSSSLPEDTCTKWAREGSFYNELVIAYGPGVLFVLPLSRTDVRDSSPHKVPELVAALRVRKIEEAAEPFAAAGQRISSHLMDLQRKAGVFKTTFVQFKGSTSKHSAPSEARNKRASKKPKPSHRSNRPLHTGGTLTQTSVPLHPTTCYGANHAREVDSESGLAHDDPGGLTTVSAQEKEADTQAQAFPTRLSSDQHEHVPRLQTRHSMNLDQRGCNNTETDDTNDASIRGLMIPECLSMSQGTPGPSSANPQAQVAGSAHGASESSRHSSEPDGEMSHSLVMRQPGPAMASQNVAPSTAQSRGSSNSSPASQETQVVHVYQPEPGSLKSPLPQHILKDITTPEPNSDGGSVIGQDQQLPSHVLDAASALTQMTSEGEVSNSTSSISLTAQSTSNLDFLCVEHGARFMATSNEHQREASDSIAEATVWTDQNTLTAGADGGLAAGSRISDCSDEPMGFLNNPKYSFLWDGQDMGLELDTRNIFEGLMM